MQHKSAWKPATVTEEHHTPRSYVVENEYGQQYRRNRRHLRPISAKFPSDLLPENRSGNETTLPPTSSSRELDNTTSDQSARDDRDNVTSTAGTPTTTTSSPTLPCQGLEMITFIIYNP